MVHIGHHICRAVFLTLYAYAAILFTSQIINETVAVGLKKFATLRSVRPVFNVGGLLISSVLFVGWIDEAGVFGVWDPIWHYILSMAGGLGFIAVFEVCVYIGVRALHMFAQGHFNKRPARIFLIVMLVVSLVSFVVACAMMALLDKVWPGSVFWITFDIAAVANAVALTITYLRMRHATKQNSQLLNRWKWFTIFTDVLIFVQVCKDVGTEIPTRRQR